MVLDHPVSDINQMNNRSMRTLFPLDDSYTGICNVAGFFSHFKRANRFMK